MHVEANRTVTDVAGEVEHRAPAPDQLHVLGMGLEVPDDALGERGTIHVLHVLQGLHDHVVVLGPGGGDGEAAVAGDHGGDPLVRRGRRAGSQNTWAS